MKHCQHFHASNTSNFQWSLQIKRTLSEYLCEIKSTSHQLQLGTEGGFGAFIRIITDTQTLQLVHQRSPLRLRKAQAAWGATGFVYRIRSNPQDSPCARRRRKTTNLHRHDRLCSPLIPLLGSLELLNSWKLNKRKLTVRMTRSKLLASGTERLIVEVARARKMLPQCASIQDSVWSIRSRIQLVMVFDRGRILQAVIKLTISNRYVERHSKSSDLLFT